MNEIPDQMLGTRRVLVGDSVYENADLTIHDGRLHIEFEADDLANITVDLRDLLSYRFG